MGEKKVQEGCGTCLWVLLLKLELAAGQATKCGPAHHPFQPPGHRGKAQPRAGFPGTAHVHKALPWVALGPLGESRLVWEARFPLTGRLTHTGEAFQLTWALPAP